MEIKITVISVYCKPLCILCLHVHAVLSIKALHLGEKIKHRSILSRWQAPVFSCILICFKVFAALIAQMDECRNLQCESRFVALCQHPHMLQVLVPHFHFCCCTLSVGDWKLLRKL